MQTPTRSSPPPEPAWREPGQVKDPLYRRSGRLRYEAEADDIVGRNGSLFNNRPLYGPAPDRGVVLGGDRPFLRLLNDRFVAGSLALGLIRHDTSAWMHDFTSIEMRYHGGRLTWIAADPRFPGATLQLTALPLDNAAGFAVRLSGSGFQPGDRLVWTFGHAWTEEQPRWRWDPIMRGNPNICRSGDPRKTEGTLSFLPDQSRSNQLHCGGAHFNLRPQPEAAEGAIGAFDPPAQLQAADAAALDSPAGLLASAGTESPVLCAWHSPATGAAELFAAVAIAAAPAIPAAAPALQPRSAFAAAQAYRDSIERIRVHTPEARLNAAVAAVCHPLDAACDRHPALFRHGCMAYSVLFLGWRVIFGAIAMGWHDRVRENARYYIDRQRRKDPDRITPQPDPKTLLTSQSPDSRFYGRGHIPNPPWILYNTQSQFFDQTLHDWRWTADPELERLLRPALDLHLDWIRDCFDPDDDGLYESYINTLPTDSVWYAGGGGVEESAYAYYAHLAARDMARRAGDPAAADRHQARADKIRRAVRSILWLPGRGHYALYREQGGHRRVHTDAWAYSQFLPVDTGLAAPFEALQALFYTEWGLERIPLPFGGELCQLSNWVPWKWSVRDLFGGDLWHLALAYFQTGLPDEGWKLLLGALLESAYAGAVPGGFSHIGAGTDFSDCKDLFARAVVEGLFGYDPDYPSGLVRIHPAWPADWPEAAIDTPDFRFDYRRDDDHDRYRLHLAQPAAMHLRLPVRGDRVAALQVNGRPAAAQVKPGFGATWLHLALPAGTDAEIDIQISGRYPAPPPPRESVVQGESVALTPARGRLVGWRDFHGILKMPRLTANALHARCDGPVGHHLILLETRAGDLPAWDIVRLEIRDPQPPARPRTPSDPARWEDLDLTPHFNADVRAIFAPDYLTPRPNTCSARIGIDGYSAWTFPHWNEKPPVIDLDQVANRTGPDGRLHTPPGIPFRVPPADRNILFTSLWDRWPTRARIPIGRSAERIACLVCGSTFPMQTRIANGVLRFQYADGIEETLELVPPFNFWMLSTWGGEDYDYEKDGFCLPPEPPPQVQLGRNCRALVLEHPLRAGIPLAHLELETLSEEVVIGLMGVSLMNRHSA